MSDTIDPQKEATITRLMQGAVDLHVHSGPSLMPRAVDHIEVVKQAAEAGMAGILLKDHYYPTMPIAHLINKHFPSPVTTLGAIVLNNPLGSLNPSAVDYALKQGARIVWMATAHAQNHIDHDKKDADFKNKFPVNSKKTVAPVGCRLIDDAGKVTDEVKLILDLVAQADAAVSGGHHHISELWPFYEEAKARGIKRLFLNHPTYVNDGSFQDVAQLARMGVMIEHSICMFVPSTFYLFDREHLRQVIDAAGVENTFFGSDLGQKNNPTPVEGFRLMIALLLDLGYGEADVRRMVATNASQFIGLS
ncbi:hypothetical protein FJ987_21355 [Mesorhizobium sp. CU2]|uniref:DUF6282 family protein n=1 Tax=unclassified Mesorhizobium TaxID=325217 RepID=UPI00112E569C|nr:MULTISPECIES: DUF6282 family protein [unclassified Mesorhizobium]TPN85608.1 hypothetical protein FJ988_08605 [Mesorhizobium sp. CU3]TPO10286.1 hypothetical protein FJ987_21355 [Mesorhizobium sp. CU2]